jgi:hypothetical protein
MVNFKKVVLLDVVLDVAVARKNRWSRPYQPLTITIHP